MKKKDFFLVVVIAIIIGSCKNNTEQSSVIRKVFYPNGELKAEMTYKIVEGDSILDGYFKKYDSIGNLIYFSETSEGFFHGKLTGYYDNGNIEFTGSKDRNKQNGTFYTYYDNEKPLEERIKVKAFKANDSLILGHYYYAESGKILEYHFFNHLGELIYYEYYNSKGEITETWGNKVPTIIKDASLANDTVIKNDSLKLDLLCIFPPTSKCEVFSRVVGYDTDWKKIEITNVDSEIRYERKIDSIGDFRFEIKYTNSNDPKVYINGFDFKVVER